MLLNAEDILSAMMPGAVIEIGDIDRLEIFNKNFNPPVIIKGGSIRNLHIVGSNGIELFNVELRHEKELNEREHTKPFTVNACENISFEICDISSDDDGDSSDDIYGLWITDSSKISIYDCIFHDLVRGMYLGGVDSFRVMGNEFFNIRTDAMDYVGVSNGKITYNMFRDFFPIAGDHADAIQFWLNTRYPHSRAVQINNNFAIVGKGQAYQFIFIETKDPTRKFTDFIIEENVGYLGSGHGATVYNGENVIIRYNTMATAPGFDRKAGIHTINPISSVMVNNNLASNYSGDQGDNKVIPDNNIFTGPLSLLEGFYAADFIGYGATLSNLSNLPEVDEPSLSGQLNGRLWHAVWD